MGFFVLEFETSTTGIYGAPRVQAALARTGTGVDRKTLAASMRRQGLEGISPRRFRPVPPVRCGCIRSRIWWKESGTPAPLDAVWIEGWGYLCAVRDACSRRVIGWAMDSTQTTSLVERALRMAYIPRGGGPAGVVFHADRSTQYTSSQLKRRLLRTRHQAVRWADRGVVG